MDPNMYLILALIVTGFALTLWLVRQWVREKPQTDAALTEWLKSMQGSIESTNKTLNEAMRGTSSDVSKMLQENTRQLNERLDNAARVISSVQKNLGEMSEVGRGIKSLQEFLQSPRLRGGIGEEVLSDMIGQTFPKNSFHLQFPFKSGVKVDAVLKTEAGLLCIDSKFPMENFKKMVKGEEGAKRAFVGDVKKHISDIAKKYVLPGEGTLDFALMYIPSESVYYEVVNLPELSTFARQSRVYPVSPNTLYAHLQVLLLSFQGKDLEAKSKQVFQLLRAIQKDYTKVEENMGTLGRHLTNAYNQMSNVSSSFGLLGQKLTQTQTLPQPDDSQT